MKAIILLITVLVTVRACNNIACSAMIAGCGASCMCDVPACECCGICVACLGTMWNDCCDCFSSNCQNSLAKNNTMNMMIELAMKTYPGNPIKFFQEKLLISVGKSSLLATTIDKTLNDTHIIKN